MADTFKVKIAGETQEFESSLKNINNAMKLLKSEGRSLEKSLKVDPTNAQAAEKLYSNLEQQLSLTKKQANETRASLDNIDPNVDFNSFVRATNRLNDLETQAQQLSGKLDSTFNNDRTLKVNTQPIDASNLTRGVDSAVTTSSNLITSKFRAATSKLGSIFSSAGSSLVSAFTKPISIVGGMFKEIGIGALREIGSNITNGVSSAFSEITSNMQDTQTAANGLKKVMDFKGITGDYKELSDALNKTAIDTNISTKDADKFGSVLVGIGKNAKDTARIVNAAANANQAFGGSGEAFTSVSVALGQTASAGKVTAENINQITDANSALGAALKSQVYENYKKAGGSANSFNEAVTAGEISVDDLNDALIQVSDKGGKAIQTLPDAMDSLKEGIGTKLQPLFDSLTTLLAGFVSQASDWVQSFDLTPIVEKLKSFNFEGFFKGVMSAIGSVISTLSSFGQTIGNIFSSITNEPLTFSTAFKAMSDFVTPIVNTLMTIVNRLGSALAKAFTSLDFDTIKTTFTSIINILTSLALVITDVLATAIKKINFNLIISGVNNILNVIGKLITFLQESGLSEIFARIFGDAANSIFSVVSTITNAISSIVKSFMPLADNVKPFVEGFASAVSGALDGTKKVINSVVNVVKDLVNAFVQQLGPGVSEFATQIKPLLKNIGEYFSTLGDIFKWLVNNIIKPLLIPVFKVLGKTISVLFSILSKAFKVINDLVNAGKKIAGKIGDFFGDMLNSGDIDSRVKNYESAINNSSSSINQDNKFTINSGPNMDTRALAREVARLIKSGVV